MENRNTEIDLLELIAKLFIYIKKYFWIFIVAIILAIVFSFVKNKMYTKTYTSSMLLRVNDENKQLLDYREIIFFPKDDNTKKMGELVTRIINTSEILRSNGNYQILANRMNINLELIKDINSIDAENNDFEEKLITITVSANNVDLFKNTEDGFVNFINSNQFVKAKKLRDSVFFTDLINNINNQDVLSKEDLILKEKLILSLKQINIVEKVEGFYKPISNKFNLKKVLFINIFVSLFASLFIIIFIVFVGKLKEYK